jgi:transposase
MGQYFRNNKALARHRQVPDEVRESAYRDFMKAIKPSIAGFYAKLKRDESTTFPVMQFKSKFAPSNTIEFMARPFKVVHKQGLDYARFKQKFFGFDKDDGIELHETLPKLTMSVRLQRLREGEYYIIVPRKKAFARSETTRVCAIDPGVRNVITVYDPEGRTFSVYDSS